MHPPPSGISHGSVISLKIYHGLKKKKQIYELLFLGGKVKRPLGPCPCWCEQLVNESYNYSSFTSLQNPILAPLPTAAVS